jgi:hypothetical protein
MQSPAENAARSAELRRRAGRRYRHGHDDARCARRDRSSAGDCNQRRYHDSVYAPGDCDDDVNGAAGNGRRIAADEHRRIDRSVHAAATAGCASSCCCAADELQHEHNSSASNGHSSSQDRYRPASADRHDGHEHARPHIIAAEWRRSHFRILSFGCKTSGRSAAA